MRRRLRYADWWLLIAVLLLSVVGVAVIHSTTSGSPRDPLFIRHLLALGVGIGVFVAAASLPYRYLDSMAYVFYATSIILLILVAVFGVSGFGAKRWLYLGPLRIQPSEMAKVATLIVIARFLAGKRVDPTRPGTILRVLLLALLPMGLILNQPDLGTALAFVGLVVATLFWAGTPFSWLVYLAALGVTGLMTFRLPPFGVALDPAQSAGTVTRTGEIALLLVLWTAFLIVVVMISTWRGTARHLVALTLVVHVGVGLAAPHAWHRLEDYQRSRVLTFLNPGRDPSGAGYQVIQSKIAIGSGELTGKGYMKGTQKALAYLPQQHTDFVFSVVGEELGFVGSVGVMGLFLLVLIRGVRIAFLARDRFASLLAAGTVGLLAYHVFVNLFMTMGLAPVTGLPLPFISYGGSFLVATMALTGILEGVAMRRHAY